VICDDIMNVDVDGPVIRTPPDFLVLHPYRGLMAAAGYGIDRVEMADLPDRECSGFIVASRT
jgi:hypothetical protein